MRKIKVPLLIVLILAMAVSTMACASDATVPVTGLGAANRAADSSPVSDATAVVHNPEPDNAEEMTAEDYFLQLLGATTALSGETAYDITTIITFGLDGTTPLTYERLLDIGQAFAVAEIANVRLPDDMFEELVEEYSLQFILTGSVDENLNLAYQFGLPTESGDVFNIFDIMIIDGVIYIGVSQYLEFVDDALSLIMPMLDEELSFLEIRAIVAIIEDILGRFDGVDFIAIDLSESADFAEFEALVQQSHEMQEEMLGMLEAFIVAISEPVKELFTERLDILSQDDDWYVVSFDDAQLQYMLEAMIEILDENAEITVDTLNQIGEAVMYSMDVSFDERVTVEEFREELEHYDPSFFEEFTGEFMFRARTNDEVTESGITAVITLVEEDITLRISWYTKASLRTQPLTAPESAITADEFLAIIEGIAQDLGMANELDAILDEFIDAFSMGIASAMPGTSMPASAVMLSEMPAYASAALVGTWRWDGYDSYNYFFYADGRGVRGFSGNTYSFIWGTDADGLVIAPHGRSVEFWTFTIADDVLTIDSRQVPGMTFSYYRVD